MPRKQKKSSNYSQRLSKYMENPEKYEKDLNHNSNIAINSALLGIGPVSFIGLLSVAQFFPLITPVAIILPAMLMTLGTVYTMNKTDEKILELDTLKNEAKELNEIKQQNANKPVDESFSELFNLYKFDNTEDENDELNKEDSLTVQTIQNVI